MLKDQCDRNESLLEWSLKYSYQWNFSSCTLLWPIILVVSGGGHGECLAANTNQNTLLTKILIIIRHYASWGFQPDVSRDAVSHWLNLHLTFLLLSIFDGHKMPKLCVLCQRERVEMIPIIKDKVVSCSEKETLIISALNCCYTQFIPVYLSHFMKLLCLCQQSLF